MAQTAAELVLRQSINLSYNDIQKALPEAPAYLIKDLFNKQSNINDLAQVSGSAEDQVIQNTADIITNAQGISDNAQNLTNHIDDTDDAHDASAISFDNSGGLAATDVQGAIDEVDSDLTDHVNADSAHGTAGDVVGTGNFATALLGGVVLLAANITNAAASTVDVTSPDATDLPSVITLANETKADVNQLVTDFNNLVTKFNAFLAANQAAKQMAP